MAAEIAGSEEVRDRLYVYVPTGELVFVITMPESDDAPLVMTLLRELAALIVEKFRARATDPVTRPDEPAA